MKAHLRTRDNRIGFEVEGASQKELFKQLAQIQEVFDAESLCGCCKSINIRFQVRTFDSNEFFELVCDACGARFQFGQAKKTNTLFPKRKENGHLLPNRGWSKWTGNTDRAA